MTLDEFSCILMNLEILMLYIADFRLWCWTDKQTDKASHSVAIATEKPHL